MQKRRFTTAIALALVAALPLIAQEPEPPQETPQVGFAQAASGIRAELDQATAELNELMESIAKQKVPLNRKLNELQAELSKVRREFNEKTRELDSGAQTLLNLQDEIKRRETETAYLSGLFVDYQREFESRLHITETKRYGKEMEAARLAPESKSLSEQEVFEAQAKLLETSLDRLLEALGGTRFQGSAVDGDGVLRDGTFVLVGPSALFLSDDGEHVGTAEQQVNSLETAILPFARPEKAEEARQLVTTGSGTFPFDPTLGTAHKFEETEETVLDEFEKGGPVMYAIVGMAGLALLIALFKWLTMAFIRRPSRRRIETMLQAVDRHDGETAQKEAAGMPGPVGRMLRAGTEHLGEPRELVEEVMFEQVLTTRLQLQRLLPFIGICAASAPLLGLLGTVSGIINTFKTITVVGSGDVKSLSGGISEALITTKYGLIVAIPSLLLHAFLSRKARGVIGQMETAAVRLANRVSMAYPDEAPEALAIEAPQVNPIRERQRMKESLREMLGEAFGVAGSTGASVTNGTIGTNGAGSAVAGGGRDEERTLEAHA